MNLSDKIHEISFLNGHRAKMIFTSGADSPETLIQRLRISKPQTLIMISGGAALLNDSHRGYLIRLFSDGIARAAIENKSMIIDGGTMSGVMSLMGLGVASQNYQIPLLGIAPSGCVMYPGHMDSIDDNIKFNPKTSHSGLALLDPNHTHFILVDSNDWGQETDLMYRLAQSLSSTNRTVTVLVNGGNIAKTEILNTVRAGWPIVLVEGSGRLADEIAAGLKDSDTVKSDEKLTEIITTGEIYCFPITGSPKDLVDLIQMQIHS